MKRKIVIVWVLLIGACVGFFLRSASGPEAPRFVPVGSDFQVPAYQRLFYDFTAERPFESGIMWVGIIPDGTNRSRAFLYDIEQKKALGEFWNAWPVFSDPERTKFLVKSYKPSLKRWFVETVEKLSRGAVKLSSSDREESFDVLDLQKNRSTRLGTVSHHSGTGSSCISSPTSRYGFIRPTRGDATFLLDLEDETMEKLEMDGDAVGWWNETGILFKTKHDDFAVYNVVNRDVSFLLQAAEVEEFLNGNKFTVDFDRKRLSAFAEWDGKENQFYFTDTHKRWEATNCFLAKMEKPSGKLKLLSSNFKFEWSDRFDSSGRYYLHTVRDFDKDPNVSAIYLRDLVNGNTRTLVESCGEKAFPLANWYGDSVIYFRSNMLWQIKLSETNSTRLFPPP
jgi:hypothetical protein